MLGCGVSGATILYPISAHVARDACNSGSMKMYLVRRLRHSKTQQDHSTAVTSLVSLFIDARIALDSLCAPSVSRMHVKYLEL